MHFNGFLPTASTFKDALDLWTNIEPIKANHDDRNPRKDWNCRAEHSENKSGSDKHGHPDHLLLAISHFKGIFPGGGCKEGANEAKDAD